MHRFHKPEDEKHTVVVLEEADYHRWLDCPVKDVTSMLTPTPLQHGAAKTGASVEPPIGPDDPTCTAQCLEGYRWASANAINDMAQCIAADPEFKRGCVELIEDQEWEQTDALVSSERQ